MATFSSRRSLYDLFGGSHPSNFLITLGGSCERAHIGALCAPLFSLSVVPRDCSLKLFMSAGRSQTPSHSARPHCHLIARRGRRALYLHKPPYLAGRPVRQ